MDDTIKICLAFVEATCRRHVDILILAEKMFTGAVELSPDTLPQFIATAAAMHPDILEMPEYHELYNHITSGIKPT
jgi:hypothetical protein